MALPIISELDFEKEVLRCEQPVLVDFFATWCAPCKQMAPELEALATELAGKVKIVKVDIDRSQRLAAMLRIQSVPTFVVFFQGRPMAAEQGVVKRARLRELVEPLLPRPQGAISAAELAPLVKERAVVPVDTRDAGSYGRAHLPGAVHMALGEIESRLAELHMLGQPVLYCRSGNKARELSDRLAKDQIDVPYLEGGLLAWEGERLPIERG
jgi:thioredoxin 1/putative thioredoxin